MNMLRVERFLDYVLTGGEHTDTTNNQNNNSDHNPTLGEGGETTSSGSGAPETSSMPTQTTPAPKSSFSSFSSSPLKRTIKQLEEEIEELRSVVADKDALLSAKVAELNSYRTKVELWKEKVKGMVTKDKERIDFLQRENDTLKALIQKTGSSNQSTSDEVLTKLKSFETKETEQTNEIVTLRSTIAEFDNKFDTLLRNHAAQISELQTTNTELCKENNYLRKVVAADGVAGQVMELQQHIASLEEHAKLKQDIATKLMVDINQQNQRIKELEDEVRETSKAVESLSMEVARCGEEKERLIGEVAEGQHVIAHLQSELKSAHNLHDDLRMLYPHRKGRD
eukprot:PhF_6_TR37220/c2_g2_i6/m.54893